MRSDVRERLVEDRAVDFDTGMREALHHESAEVLRHQIHCERDGAVRARRPDLLLSFICAGFGVGVGIASAMNGSTKRTKGRKRR